MKFSVIIITYNEEEKIGAVISSILTAAVGFNVEIIVSDGGSSDSTIDIVKEFNFIIIQSQMGRGIQSKLGAKAAKGDIFLFLHGDTIFPQNGFKLLTNYFSNDFNKCAKFRLSFDNNKKLFDIYSWFTKFDSLFTSFGDQCLSIRKENYFEVGGHPDWQIFEDVKLLQLIRSKYKIYSLQASVKTSARRFEKNGILKQQLRNFLYILFYLFGVKEKKLKALYENTNKN